MQDRFVRGYLAGAVAGVIMAVLDLIPFMLGITKVRYLDMAAVVIWGDFPKATWEEIFAQVLHIAVAGLFGIAFAYLLPRLESKYLLLKGSTYGAATWFIMHTSGSFFHVPILEKSTPETTLSHLVTATIYGLVLASVLAWLENYVKSEQKSHMFSHTVPSPAYKHYTPPTPPEEDDDESK